MASKAQIIDFLLAGYRDTQNDQPLNAGTVTVTVAGTSNIAYVWDDRDKTLPTVTGRSTVTLDAYGKAEVYGDGIYKFVIKDSSGSTVETIDYYSSKDYTAAATRSSGTAVDWSAVVDAPTTGLVPSWEGIRRSINVGDYDDGNYTDAAWAAAYADANIGDTIVLTEPLMFTTQIDITKRVNLLCRDGGWFQPNVGLGGFAISTSGLAVNQVDWDIKIFGFADSCVNALYLDGTNLSDIRATIQTGCSEYAFVTQGCILSNFKFTSSSNYASPLAGSVLPNNGLRMSQGISHDSPNHATRYDLRLEGSPRSIGDIVIGTNTILNATEMDLWTIGDLITNQYLPFGTTVTGLSGTTITLSGNATSTETDERFKTFGIGVFMEDGGALNTTTAVKLTGTIEGLGGYGLLLTNAKELSIDTLYAELNGPGYGNLFTDVSLAATAVRTSGRFGSENKFVRSIVDITDCDGKLEFDADCSGIVNGFYIQDPGDIVNNSENVILNGVITQEAGVDTFDAGGLGSLTMENIFKNPFMDVWSDGPNAAPDGVTSPATTFARNTANVWPRNPYAVSMYCVNTAAVLGDGVTFSLDAPLGVSTRNRWISVTLAIWTSGVNPDIRLVVTGSSASGLAKTVTTKAAWDFCTFGVLIQAGQVPSLIVTPWDGANYVPGNFYIGGIAVTEGLRPLGQLVSSGKRENAIADSITFAPSFVGQRALVAGAWYMAKDVSAPTDWVAL